jgi:hypothetical protein
MSVTVELRAADKANPVAERSTIGVQSGDVGGQLWTGEQDSRTCLDAVDELTSAKGDTMSQFVNFALTVGQQLAPNYGYPSLGQSLEQLGLEIAHEGIPGAVPETDFELAECDLTVAEVQAGQTTPTCGSGPGTGTTEVPFVLALPVAALGILGGSVAFRRRRERQMGSLG